MSLTRALGSWARCAAAYQRAERRPRKSPCVFRSTNYARGASFQALQQEPKVERQWALRSRCSAQTELSLSLIT